MTLSFNPLDSYAEMTMDLTEEKLKHFFELVGCDTDDYDEGLLYDCEA